MKKTITKLVLRRETIRKLVDAELRTVAAGHEDWCNSKVASGCPPLLAEAAVEGG
jgi:hypothetical protein